ncbi:amino acid transporter heavy chain SLC3A1-like [Corticium candelabrum]|uniref:amino acid transporter heavy chain SLC3A1-like n=1 Tax=Corticium candelabrum TaxID=121492 RepID=UPI002E26FDF7|nr:amino acid transporter heavy chain SLC3A1-like [Corticium candelabrum]
MISVAMKDQLQVPSPRRFYVILRYMLVALISLSVIGLLSSAVVLIVISKPCPNTKWWQNTLIYQLYPRSFKDSNGDGIGDLVGIKSKLDYFKYLHVDAIWINPIFSSPMRDFGYDISDYKNIDPIFGTLTDFDDLLKDAHEKGLKIILDFVPNHTSDKHPWFMESRKNRYNPKRDWYVWADGINGEPPNNWQSVFGGSAWQYDNITDQYYLHQFLSQQPDLNYRNEDVRDAMKSVLVFWLEKGVDGFRIDAIKFLLEDVHLRSEMCLIHEQECPCHSLSYEQLNHTYTENIAGIHDIVKEWKKVINSYSNQGSLRFMVGEIYDDDISTIMSYYGSPNDMDECDFPFNFLLVDLPLKEWTGTGVNDTVAKWLDASPNGAWPNWVVGNHDNPRIASKLGIQNSALVMMLLLTLPGTPTTYYGDELGMTDVFVPFNATKDQMSIGNATRDPERSPMQWDNSLHAGFTSGCCPWLPVGNFTTVNVHVAKAERDSVLNVYRSLALLRSNVSALQGISYTPIYADTSVYIFQRGDNSDILKVVVALNFGNEFVTEVWQHVTFAPHGVVMLSTRMDRNGQNISRANSELHAGEGVVVQIGHT